MKKKKNKEVEKTIKKLWCTSDNECLENGFVYFKTKEEALAHAEYEVTNDSYNQLYVFQVSNVIRVEKSINLLEVEVKDLL